MATKKEPEIVEGILCPACHYFESKISDTRRKKDSFRRMRVCLKCGFVFYTNEYLEIEESFIYIEKKNSQVQKLTFAKIDNTLRRYMTDSEEYTLTSKLVRDWLLDYYAKEKGKKMTYKRAKVITIPEHELKKLIMAAISISNFNISTNYYLNEIASKDSKDQVSQMNEIAKILNEIKPYVTQLKRKKIK